MDANNQSLENWLSLHFGKPFSMSPLQGDASFRSYFRVWLEDKTYIVMLAPPSRGEQTAPFVTIARGLAQHGLPVPEVLNWDPEQGFVLLSDLGDTLLLDQLNDQSVDGYYSEAMKLLKPLQSAPLQVPVFDETHLRRELSLFRDWFVEKLLGIHLTSAVEKLFEQMNQILIHHFHSQPQVVVHRDYHSRNLMVLNENHQLGIIDFQDAMIGPITYDLVSLLKDCYIDWPREKVCGWVKQFCSSEYDDAEFLQWFDAVGLQRHLKVLGIFSRLKLRDNKPGYLKDTPRILNYVLEATKQIAELEPFDHWLREEIVTRTQPEIHVA